MRYLDVCAGISASSVAWKPLGWEAAAYSEIEPAPRAILEHRQGAVPVGWDHRHAPSSNITPLFGDFTQIEDHHVGPIDLLVGGTPCQDFSVAGLRAGLDGDRGNLSLEFLRLADRTRPRWLVWENVPGVLSISGGRAFGAILGGMGELGYGFAYRVLDAQHFGVPQRRRRVFVVGYLGDHRRAGAVLFERHSMSGHPAPRRHAGPSGAALTANGVGTCCADDNQGQAGHLIASTDEISHCLNAGGMGRQDYEAKTLIAFNGREDLCHSESVFGALGSSSPQAAAIVTPIDMRQASRGATMTNNRADGSRGGAPGTGIGQPGDPAPTVSTSHVAAVAFDLRGREGGAQFEGPHDTANIRAANGGSSRSYVATSAVRRLTPRECERLQGFPDDYTLVPYRKGVMADSPRYKALGNSMAVPVMRWIGERIEAADSLTEKKDMAA